MTETEWALIAAAPPSGASMVAVRPTPDQSSALALDGHETADELHVTLVYFPDHVDEEAVARAISAATDAHPERLEGAVTAVTAFPEGKAGHPIVAIPSVVGLTELRAAVAEALDAEGVPYSTEHGFVPHITLAYGDVALVDAAADRVGLDVTFERVCHEVAGEDSPRSVVSLTAAAWDESRVTRVPAGTANRSRDPREGGQFAPRELPPGASISPDGEYVEQGDWHTGIFPDRDVVHWPKQPLVYSGFRSGTAGPLWKAYVDTKTGEEKAFWFAGGGGYPHHDMVAKAKGWPSGVAKTWSRVSGYGLVPDKAYSDFEPIPRFAANAIVKRHRKDIDAVWDLAREQEAVTAAAGDRVSLVSRASQAAIQAVLDLYETALAGVYEAVMVEQAAEIARRYQARPTVTAAAWDESRVTRVPAGTANRARDPREGGQFAPKGTTDGGDPDAEADAAAAGFASSVEAREELDLREKWPQYADMTDEELLRVQRVFTDRVHGNSLSGLVGIRERQRDAELGRIEPTPVEAEEWAKVTSRYEAINRLVAARKASAEWARLEDARRESTETGVLTIGRDEYSEMLGKQGDVYQDARWSGGYNPDLFITSDLSGLPIRHYVTLPDGRVAHPDELHESRKRGRLIVVPNHPAPRDRARYRSDLLDDEARKRLTAAVTAAAGDERAVPADDLVDRAEIERQIAARTEAIRQAAAVLVAESALEAVGLSFDVRPMLTDRILARVGVRAADMADSARDAVIRAVTAGIEQGWSVPQTAGMIQAGIVDASPATSRMLARTDLIGVGNASSIATARMILGEDRVYKRWINADDARVRPTHVEAEGQTVPLDQPFQVGGFPLDFPGDPDGPDAEVCNCRCTVVYTSDPDADVPVVTAAYVESEHPRDPGGQDGGRWVAKGTPAADEGEPDDDYRGWHEAPGRDGIPLVDLAGETNEGLGGYPLDIYGDPDQAARFYGHGGRDTVAMDKETIRILQGLRGKPDADVVVYRAVPGGVEEINPGDWVTVNRDYADLHLQSQGDESWRIVERTVKAGDLFTDADSIHEHGWAPEDAVTSAAWDESRVTRVPAGTANRARDEREGGQFAPRGAEPVSTNGRGYVPAAGSGWDSDAVAPVAEAWKQPEEKRVGGFTVDGVWVEDKALEDIAKVQGFAGLPEVVSEDEFDRREGRIVFRGVSEVEHAREYVDGDYWAGLGTSGSGTYVTTEFAEAFDYAGDHGAVLKMRIRPEATSWTYPEARMQSQIDSDGRGYAVRSGVDGYALLPVGYWLRADAGRVTAAYGYDMIDGGPDESRAVVVNRTATVVQDTYYDVVTGKWLPFPA